MSNLKTIVNLCIFLMAISGYAQYNPKAVFENIQLSYSKTTSIVFPYAVKSLDIGSRDVLIQKAKGVENILLLKAGKQNFYQTNLTVVTSDAKLYVFVLNYNEECPDLNIKAEKIAAANEEVLFSMENENKKKIEQLASLALLKKKKTNGLKSTKFKIGLEVNGIFIHQDILYLRVAFENNSRINYDIEQLRFFIRDKRKSKRTAMQELEIIPLYAASSSLSIPDQSKVINVYALEKFTIPEKKILTLQMIEKNGGRHLEVAVDHAKLADKVISIQPFNNTF